MTVDRQAEIDVALTRAVVYHALSIAFQRPTNQALHELGAGERFATVVGAMLAIDRHQPGSRLAAAAARLVAWEVPRVEELQATFVRLFGHTTRGLVCACETEYGDDNNFHQPQQLADIAGYYLAFGLRPALASDARADHVACECEFMDFLNRKEARLLTGGADEDGTLEVTRSAARAFLREHLGRFGRAFASRALVEDPNGFFGIFGAALLGMLDAESRRLRVAAGPIELAVRPATEDDTPMACGTGDQLIQIQRRP